MEITVERILSECYNDPNILKYGLEYLAQYYTLPNFFSSIAAYIVNHDKSYDYRKISFIFVLKNIVRVGWVEVIPEDQKHFIISSLMANVGDNSLFIQSNIAQIFAYIAQKLMPNVFEPLLQPLFIQALNQCEGVEVPKNSGLLAGSFKAILYSLQECNDDRISQHAKHALPLILRLLSNPVIKKNPQRLEEAWSILHQYVKTLHWANGTDDMLIKEVMDPHFNHIGGLIEELFVSTNYDQLIDVKRVAIRVLTVMFRDLTNYTEPFISKICVTAWRLLSAYVYYHLETLSYETVAVFERAHALEFEEEEDSPAVGLEGFEIQLLELATTLVPREIEATTGIGQKSMFADNMRQFIWLLCTYVQIKKSEADVFVDVESLDETEVVNAKIAINNFVALEEDDSTSSSVRNAAIQLIGELIRLNPEIISLLTEIIGAFMQNKPQNVGGDVYPLSLMSPDYQKFYYESSNPMHAVLKQETALFLFGRYAPEIKESLTAPEVILSEVFRNYALPAIKLAGTSLGKYENLFKYRGLCTTVQILEELTEYEHFESLSQEVLMEVYNILINVKSNLAVKLAACKVLACCSKVLQKVSEKDKLQNFAVALMQVLIKSSSDTCVLVLRAMCGLCKNPYMEQIPEAVEQMFERSLKTFIDNHGEFEVSEEIMRLAASVLSHKGASIYLKVIPTIRKFVGMTIGSKKLAELDSGIIQRALDMFSLMIEKVFKEGKGIDGPGVLEIQSIMNIIIRTILTTDDTSFIISAFGAIRSYLAYAFNTLTEQMRNELFELVFKLATSSDSIVHSELGYILIHIFARIRQFPNPVIPNACLHHLQSALSPTIVLSYVVVFAYLIHFDMETTMAYLLQIKMLLEKWITFSFYFSGEVTVPLCMSALGELLIHKWELLNSIRLKVENEEKKAPAAILKAFLQHIFNTSGNKEVTYKESAGSDYDIDVYEVGMTREKSNDEYEPEVTRSKDADLKIYPEINTYCSKMTTMMERIREFRATHKAIFEEWKAELDGDEQQRVDIHFPIDSQ